MTSGSKKKSQRKLENTFEKNENENTAYQNMGCSETSAQGDSHSYKCLHQKIKSITVCLKELKKNQTKPKASAQLQYKFSKVVGYKFTNQLYFYTLSTI